MNPPRIDINIQISTVFYNFFTVYNYIYRKSRLSLNAQRVDEAKTENWIGNESRRLCERLIETRLQDERLADSPSSRN